MNAETNCGSLFCIVIKTNHNIKRESFDLSCVNRFERHEKPRDIMKLHKQLIGYERRTDNRNNKSEHVKKCSCFIINVGLFYEATTVPLQCPVLHSYAARCKQPYAKNTPYINGRTQIRSFPQASTVPFRHLESLASLPAALLMTMIRWHFDVSRPHDR
jgi:hypothetical protein